MTSLHKILLAAVFSASIPWTTIAQDLSGKSFSKGLSASGQRGLLSQLHKDLAASLNIGKDFTTSSIEGAAFDFYQGVGERGNNIPMASVTDAQGNTFVTGASSNTGQAGGDLLTIKFSPTGIKLWEARQSALAFAVDSGMVISLDTQGNPIVSGVSWNGQDMDMQTIKYDRNDGAQLWRALYAGQGAGLDMPSAMTLNAQGELVIAGMSWSGNSLDFITLKYDATGTQLLEMRNNGYGEGTWNEPSAVAMDSAGNIIVAGFSQNQDDWLDYYTVKYDPAGNQLWSNRYNFEAPSDEENPEENLLPSDCEAYAVAVDAQDNIYVCGSFHTFNPRIGTIKYAPDGQQQWVNVYKSGTEQTNGYAIAFRDEKIYVAGGHHGEYTDDGPVLLSYSTQGTQNWVAEGHDYINITDVSLAFDLQGRPVVGGYGMMEGLDPFNLDTGVRFSRYNVDGTPQGSFSFIVPYTGTATVQALRGLSIDSQGSLLFTMSAFYSDKGNVFQAVKADFGGTAPLWSSHYSNAGFADATLFNAVADSLGNTYCTAAYYIFNPALAALEPTYMLIKYNAQGAKLWEKAFNPQEGETANGLLLGTDIENNVIVCLLPFDNIAEEELAGQTLPSTLVLKKFSPEGNLIWETEKDFLDPLIYTMQGGPSGEIFLCGTAKQAATDLFPKFAAAKFTSAGTEAWTMITGGQAGGLNNYSIQSAKATTDGGLIMAGAMGTDDFFASTSDLTALKINSDGQIGWIRPVPYPNMNGGANCLALGADGTIVVAGSGMNQSGTFDYDMLTAKLDSEGTVLWTQKFGVPDKGEKAFRVGILSTGAVAVAGFNRTPDAEIVQNILLQYDSQGSKIWDISSPSKRYLTDFIIDGSDKCFLFNQAISPTFPFRVSQGPFPVGTLLSVSAEGTPEEEFFTAPQYSEFYPRKMVSHKDGRLLLAGDIANQSFYRGFYFFETQHDGILGGDKHTPGPVVMTNLGQNYPNPAEGLTTIPFYLTQGGDVTITLYDGQGREVATIFKGSSPGGSSAVEFDASRLSRGIYYYQMRAGSFSQGRKMVIE